MTKYVIEAGSEDGKILVLVLDDENMLWDEFVNKESVDIELNGEFILSEETVTYEDGEEELEVIRIVLQSTGEDWAGRN